MNTNSRIKKYKSYGDIKKSNLINADAIPTYASMKDAIKHIAHPIPFEFLKSFYGLK